MMPCPYCNHNQWRNAWGPGNARCCKCLKYYNVDFRGAICYTQKVEQETGMNQMRKLPPCGNPSCSCSTGIHDGLTFGSGELDHNGFWQFPCRVCAKLHDETIDEQKHQVRSQMVKEGRTQQMIDNYIANAEWLNLPAWPYAQEESNGIPAADGLSASNDHP